MSAGAGTAAITITAGPSDKINIRGVVLDGFGIANNIGIQFNTGGSLNVQDSEIRNFGNDGISFDPSATAVLLVSNTLVSDNGSSGIFISGGGSGGLAGTLDHVTLEHNATDGLHVQNFNATQSDNFTISDSVSAHNGTDGVNVIAGSGSITQVMVQNSTIANNGTGLAASGAGAPVLRVTRSTITGNGSGWSISTNGVVASYVDNIIDGNGNNNSTPAGTPPTYH
jgi:hypothetical protein